jgi:hypothetical protein
MGEVLHYRLGKFEGHACNGADFGRFLSVASVAQLAEQLTLKFGRAISGVFTRSHALSNRRQIRGMFISCSRPFLRFAPQNFTRDTIWDTI